MPPAGDVDDGRVAPLVHAEHRFDLSSGAILDAVEVDAQDPLPFLVALDQDCGPAARICLLRDPGHVGRAVKRARRFDDALHPVLDLSIVANIDVLQVHLGVLVDFLDLLADLVKDACLFVCDSNGCGAVTGQEMSRRTAYSRGTTCDAVDSAGRVDSVVGGHSDRDSVEMEIEVGWLLGCLNRYLQRRVFVDKDGQIDTPYEVTRKAL